MFLELLPIETFLPRFFPIEVSSYSTLWFSAPWYIATVVTKAVCESEFLISNTEAMHICPLL